MAEFFSCSPLFLIQYHLIREDLTSHLKERKERKGKGAVRGGERKDGEREREEGKGGGRKNKTVKGTLLYQGNLN